MNCVLHFLLLHRERNISNDRLLASAKAPIIYYVEDCKALMDRVIKILTNNHPDS